MNLKAKTYKTQRGKSKEKNLAKFHHRREEYSMDKISPKKPFRLEDLKVAINRVKDCKQPGFIGGDITLFGIKNPTSFLIGTESRGVKLIENGAQLFVGKLPVKYKSLRDIIYIPPLNCYFLNHHDKFYRKDINNKAPYLYIDVSCSLRYGGCFRYSLLNHRLIISKDCLKISVINPKTRKVEVSINKNVGNEVQDFRVFGEQRTKVVAVTMNGYVLLYSLSFGQKRGMLGDSKIELMWERGESPKSIAVCEKNRFVLLGLGQSSFPFISSRMMIFQVYGDTLVQAAVIDHLYQDIGSKYSIDCLRYVGTHLLWVGLAFGKNGPVQVYDYNTESGELKELEDKRISHQENMPFKLHRLNDKFYYTGLNGQVMSLSFSN